MATVPTDRPPGNANRHEPPAIEMVPLTALRPSPKNDLLYRPSDLAALAEDIRENGLKQPIVATRCGVIISGHRRYAACKLAGLTHVPVIREDIDPDGPDFVAHLARHNIQRVKGADELIREQLALTNPDEAYEELIHDRGAKVRVNVPTVHLRGESKRAAISEAKAPFLKAIQEVIDDNSEFWPLSDRQVHYRLLNSPPLIHASKPASRYRNDFTSYKALCELLTRARIEGEVDFDAIDDPTRPVTNWDVHAHVGTFIRREVDGFLRGYYRDRMQSQALHIEIVGEKNTVASVIRPVAAKYTVPFTIGRGYASLPPRQKMAERFESSGKDRLLILFVTDFDPEGEDIPHSFARSLRDDFGLGGRVSAAKVALNREHVARFGLVPQMKAKAKSSRHARFVGANGNDVYELEAIPPSELQNLIEEGVCSAIDVVLYKQEVAAERADAAVVKAFKTKMRSLADGVNWAMAQSGASGGAL